MCYETQMPRTKQIPEVAIVVKTQGQNFKIYGSNIKVLLQVTCMKYKSPITYHSKDMAKVKILKSGLNFKVKVTK
jgi:hypothetical protein